MQSNKDIVLIIPARNEELSLPTVLSRVPAMVTRVVVVDNGSTDGTGDIARAQGAQVVIEPSSGYGSACLAGISAISDAPPAIVAFADGDGSDGVENLEALLRPLLNGEADLSLARRVPVASRALSPQQRFGNWLATRLIRFIWGHDYHDLGPMRAITWQALQRLRMSDKSFGWTVEMQVKALKVDLRVVETSFPYHIRIAGESKISRTVTGTIKAGVKIIWVIGREALCFRANRTKEEMMTTGKPQVRSGAAARFLFGFMMMVSLLPCFAAPAAAVDLGLIEPAALNRTPGGWVVLDARPKAEWQGGHITGAQSFSWENYTRTDAKGVPYKIWPAEELAQALGRLGIGEKTPVVVYGDADKSWGGEGWAVWALSFIGHKGPIRLLDGGIQAWRNQGLPLKTTEEKRKTVHYRISSQLQLDISTVDLERSRENSVLVDTRSTFEWLKGRIPGAIHIPWDDFFSGKERRPLASDEVKKLLAKNGVDTAKPIIYYCAGGIRSAYVWTVHTLAGLPAARNYEGGFEEWQRLAQK
jgi:thiosulfate/3-mercaptopyruvate sulfurtransferase